MTMGLVHAARQIEAQGRGPDTSLAHISPDESAMLDYMQGGRRMNPVTGLPEYSTFGKILKAVARVGATVGAGFISGWNPYVMAAANGAATKLTGGSWKQAGIGAVTTGLTAGMLGPTGFTGVNANPITALQQGALGSQASQGLLTEARAEAAKAATKKAAEELAKTGVQEVAKTAAPGLMAQGVNYLKANPALMAAGAAGLGSLLGKPGTPATPLPTPYQAPYDPNNVFSWMRPNRGGLLPGQTPRSPIPQPDPINFYNQDMGYADGGDVAPVGMGLPQSAAMPQLMSAAQFGYLNARTGGRIAGPGDGKSDDIPALLSNGEHVIDAATVSDLGNGDNDTGQKRLEEIKHKIRSSAGRKNPRKASPKQKGLGSLLNSARA